jgi:hypothetical protein
MKFLEQNFEISHFDLEIVLVGRGKWGYMKRKIDWGKVKLV